MALFHNIYSLFNDMYSNDLNKNELADFQNNKKQALA